MEYQGYATSLRRTEIVHQGEPGEKGELDRALGAERCVLPLLRPNSYCNGQSPSEPAVPKNQPRSRYLARPHGPRGLNRCTWCDLQVRKFILARLSSGEASGAYAPKMRRLAASVAASFRISLTAAAPPAFAFASKRFTRVAARGVSGVSQMMASRLCFSRSFSSSLSPSSSSASSRAALNFASVQG